MPTFRLSCFTNPTILSSIDPPRLRAFLMRFRDYLEARGFQIPARDAFAESDYATLIRILHSPSAQTPSEMTQALWHIDDMSSDQGMEALLLAASKNGIAIPDSDRLTPSDLAIHIWLQDPSVLRHANAERVVTKVKSFEYFRNRNIEPPELKTPTETDHPDDSSGDGRFQSAAPPRWRCRCFGASDW